MQCDGYMKVSVSKVRKTQYLETSISNDQNHYLLINLSVRSLFPKEIEFDKIELQFVGHDPLDLSFSITSATVNPGLNSFSLPCRVATPPGEYLVDKAIFSKGSLSFVQSFLTLSKSILRVTQNRSTLQLFVTEPDREEALSGMTMLRRLRISMVANQETLQSGSTLQITSRDLNLRNQECQVVINGKKEQQQSRTVSMVNGAIKLPEFGNNLVVEINIEAELKAVNRLEHEILFGVKYVDFEGRAFTVNSNCQITFSLPFEFQSRVYYHDNNPFVGVLLKSLCERRVIIKGTEIDTSLLPDQLTNFLHFDTCPKKYSFPKISLESYQDFSIVYQVKFDTSRSVPAGFFGQPHFVLFHIEYEIVENSKNSGAVLPNALTKITYPLEFSFQELVGWYGVQLLPPIDMVTVGEMCRCELEFCFKSVFEEKLSQFTDAHVDRPLEAKHFNFCYEFIINDKHWILSGHRVKYFNCSPKETVRFVFRLIPITIGYIPLPSVTISMVDESDFPSQLNNRTDTDPDTASFRSLEGTPRKDGVEDRVGNDPQWRKEFDEEEEGFHIQETKKLKDVNPEEKKEETVGTGTRGDDELKVSFCCFGKTDDNSILVLPKIRSFAFVQKLS